MLQTEVSDQLRGRVFATLYTSTRLCLFLALIVSPFLSTLFDGLSRSLFDRRIDVGGITIHLAGVRLTLWFGGLVILGGGMLAQRALRSASE
jgi:dTMP kinase